MTGDAGWVSAHAFHHGPLDPLIVEVVHPLITELAGAGLVDRYFFLRYWDGGPHLRLRVRPLDQDRRAEVEALVVARLDRYLRDHPSAATMSAHDYRLVASTIGRIEGVGYEPALRPADSVSLIGYRRETHRYGTGESVLAVERHFAESSEIAMDVLRAFPTSDQLVRAAYAMLLLTWFIADPEPAVAGPADPVPPGAVELARQMRSLARERGGGGAGELAAWARSVAVLRDVLTGLEAAGRFARGVPAVIDICAHLICNRLGVTMDLEARLRRTALRAASVLRQEA
ncbi:lantibiotic dehydratase C-terminal domain-containing protein [Amycolatopsis lurida]